MAQQSACLYLFCGKIASGKSTLARKLAVDHDAILIGEDEWLSTLYPDMINSIDEFQRYSGNLETVLSHHIRELLKVGTNIVLDFHANTLKRRDWMSEMLDGFEVRHEMHVLEVSDEICRARLRARNVEGTHAYEASDEVFDQFTKYFHPPQPSEEWFIIRHENFDGDNFDNQ